MMRQWLVGIATALLLTACADPVVQQYNTALAHLSGRNYEVAVPQMLALAENGYAPAQFRLGFMQFNGMGTARDTDSAMQWFTRAAEQGDVGGQYSLALIYSKGAQPFGIAPDPTLALQWWERLAAREFVPAQFQLARLLETGRGGDPDHERALHWYERAAERYHKQAVLRLIEVHNKGQMGQTPDIEKVSYWQSKLVRKPF